MVDKEEDLYLNNLCRSWNDALDDFYYYPTIGTDISQTINDEQINLTECDAYVAGTEVQISGAQEWLFQNGLEKNQLFTNSRKRCVIDVLPARGNRGYPQS